MLHDVLSTCFSTPPEEVLAEIITPQNINCKDASGAIALHQAVRHRNFDLLRVLLAHGADVNMRDFGNEDDTVLHLAMKLLDFHDVSESELHLFIPQLISAQNINMQNRRGNTPLHLAAACDEALRIDIIIMLLEHGASVSVQNKEEYFPLMCCFGYFLPEVAIVKLLVPDDPLHVVQCIMYLFRENMLCGFGNRLNVLKCLLQHLPVIRITEIGFEKDFYGDTFILYINEARIRIDAPCYDNKVFGKVVKMTFYLLEEVSQQKLSDIFGCKDYMLKDSVDRIDCTGVSESSDPQSLTMIAVEAIRRGIVRHSSVRCLSNIQDGLGLPTPLMKFFMWEKLANELDRMWFSQ